MMALIILLPLVPAPTTNTTTMTWVVPSSKSHTLTYGGSCNASLFYFVESNAVFDSDVDGNASQVLPYDAESAGSACQAVGTAPILITNNGNVTIDIDANFVNDFSGNDVNLAVKVWMGTGSGCGTDGLGGWEQPCSVLGTANPVTATTCRDFNQLAETTTARLVENILTSDTNQLCFSGDFYGEFAGELVGGSFGVPQGSRTNLFDTNAS